MFALLAVLLLPFLVTRPWPLQLPSAPDAAPIVTALPDVDAEVWKSRGDVVHLEPYDDPPVDDRERVLGQAWRAEYTSVSGLDGGKREVSGAFFVPRGTPPKDGWPLISLAHGTTGIGHDCGPSRQSDLMGYGPMVESFLAEKYAVAMTDYEGLGESGSHPYLEPRTAAFNTVDAARAMRDISPTVSTRWVAVGYSQGGQAVWAANELDSFYGNDLQLLGTVALAPAVNLTGVADLVASGSLTAEQRAQFPMGLIGFSRYTPDVDPDSFLHGAAEYFEELHDHCEPPESRQAPPREFAFPIPWLGVAARLRDANDVKPSSPRDAAVFRDEMRRTALPQRPLEKPMLVMVGNDDAQVLPEWIRSAVSRSCELGAQIELVQIPDTGHNDLVPKVTDTLLGWTADRFSGTPAPSNCSGGVTTPNGS